MKIWLKSLIAIVLGIIAGILIPQFSGLMKILDLFNEIIMKALIFSVKPLLFVTIIYAFYKIKESKKNWKIFPLFFGFTAISGLAVFLQSFLWGYFLKPGSGIDFFKTEYIDQSQFTFNSFSYYFAKFIPESIENVLSGNPAMIIPTIIVGIGVGIAIFYAVKRGQIFYNMIQSIEEIFDFFSLYLIEISSFALFFIVMNITIQFKGLENFYNIFNLLVLAILILIFHSIVIPSLLIRFVCKKSPVQFYRSILGAIFYSLTTGSLISSYTSNYFHSYKNLGIDKEYSAPLVSFGTIFNMDGIIMFVVLNFFFIVQLYSVDFTNIFEPLKILSVIFLAALIRDGIPNAEIPVLLLVLSYAQIISTDEIAYAFVALFIISRISTVISTISIHTINFILVDKFHKETNFVDYKEQI